MKYSTYFILLMMLFMSNSISAQSELIKAGNLFQYEDTIYTKKTVKDLMASSPEATSRINAASANHAGGYVMLFLGSAAIGNMFLIEHKWDRDNRTISAAEYLGGMFLSVIVVGASTVGAIVLFYVSKRRTVQAIDAFNRSIIKDVGHHNSTHLKFGSGQHGVGLVLQF